MNRLSLILYVNFTLCLLFAGAQDEIIYNYLPLRHLQHLYFRKTTLPDLPTSTTVKPILTILNTNRSKRMARRNVIEDIVGTPSSTLKMDKSSVPSEIPKYILNAIFGPKFEAPKNETPPTIAGEPPDSQNSTDTSNLEDRFLTVSLLKYLYHGPENHVNDNPIPENHNDSRQGLITERRITTAATVQNDKNSVPKSKNAANLNFIHSLLILFEFLIVLNVL